MSLKFTDKNFKQPNCFWLSMHANRILLSSETDDSRFNSREKHMLTCAHRLSSAMHIINGLLTSLVRSSPWNIRPLFILKNLGLIFHNGDRTSEVNKPLILHIYIGRMYFRVLVNSSWEASSKQTPWVKVLIIVAIPKSSYISIMQVLKLNNYFTWKDKCLAKSNIYQFFSDNGQSKIFHIF